MAKQTGLFKVEGTLDGITFYKRNGKDLMKKASGISKERIKNDPSFKRTRENNQEFGGAAVISKGIRMGLIDLLHMTDGNFISRAVTVCKKILREADGIRGQRPFYPVANKELLAELVFQREASLERVFKAPFTITVPVSRNEATIVIPDFNTSNMLSPPQGATHFSLINHVSVLSAYEFNATLQKYEPTNFQHNSMYASADTVIRPIGGMVGATSTLRALLYDVEELPLDAVLIVCLGIQFYQQAGGSYYDLATQNALKIVQIS